MMSIIPHTYEAAAARSLPRDERAWEGQVGGHHWIARVVQLDEEQGICGLHVASGAERDQVPNRANCRWDYERDHILDRFSLESVPVGVTCEMLAGLRRWLEDFRRRRGESSPTTSGEGATC